MTTLIECTEGHYEVHKTSYGEAYVWCPGSAWWWIATAGRGRF